MNRARDGGSHPHVSLIYAEIVPPPPPQQAGGFDPQSTGRAADSGRLRSAARRGRRGRRLTRPGKAMARHRERRKLFRVMGVR